MGRSKKSFLERLVLEQEGVESVLEENLAFVSVVGGSYAL